MSFFQTPPTLGDQYESDRVLRGYLLRSLPGAVLHDIEPSLREMGRLMGGPFYEMQQRDRENLPHLIPFDPWGRRIDQIEVTPLWREAQKLAATHGLVATAYERAHGEHSRVHQFALTYLFEPSSDVYTCPLAMTDGAARTLVVHGNRALLDRALPRLTSRDPGRMWTSGQWMTERTGGSDVGISETVARPVGDGSGQWRLYGTKWFTSATTAEMALTLARPEGNGPGGRGLALFYLETRIQDEGAAPNDPGRLNGITINRLKDKLGTRKVPTAELTLDGTLALPVLGTGDGVRAIAPMLNITRTWNAVGAVGGMRRSLALCRDYANKRVAFGARLSEKPLHVETLAGMQAEYEGAFHLSFRAVELLGKEEAGTLTPAEAELLRLLVPIAKLLTARQAVAVASEALECFGGAGYVEDTGLPRLLRDAQVLSIWEGTTNVLSLDVLRVLGKAESSLATLKAEVDGLCRDVRQKRLVAAAQAARDTLARAERFVHSGGPKGLEAGARRFAMTLGRTTELALLLRHGQWSLDHQQDGRPAAAALRLWRNGIDLLGPDGQDGDDDAWADGLLQSAALANDSEWPQLAR